MKIKTPENETEAIYMLLLKAKEWWKYKWNSSACCPLCLFCTLLMGTHWDYVVNCKKCAREFSFLEQYAPLEPSVDMSEWCMGIYFNGVYFHEVVNGAQRRFSIKRRRFFKGLIKAIEIELGIKEKA
jgi:hypothetical protein